MKKTGAALVRFALEQLGIRHTFGIPGVHTTELYDQLHSSEHITPILVTHEGGAAFMADAVSRTGAGIGTLLIVPAAGVTHAASGIGEAGIDGIPMLILCGGIHSESDHRYQLHEMDQHALLTPITKATWRIRCHEDVIPTLYRAYETAVSGEPGPVFVEIPYNIGNFLGEVERMPEWRGMPLARSPERKLIETAARELVAARQPGFFVGWGAMQARQALITLAEHLEAPVATTLQGLSAFPADHPLHTGMGMGEYAVPAATEVFAEVDCLLAVGTRFSEIPTGSYGVRPPPALIHVDINPAVFNANYPARHVIEGDAATVMPALLEEVMALKQAPANTGIHRRIAGHKAAYRQEWRSHDSKDRVNPVVFFDQLRRALKDDAIIVADDGNHTFLAAELMPIIGARTFLSPSDFNAMGYCVPAVIGARLANPDRQVVGIAGDGAFAMTAMELLTAAREELGVVVFVFNDGELSQIAQAQYLPYRRKTCTVLGKVDYGALARALGTAYVELTGNGEVADAIDRALELAADGKAVVVNVHIDYSKPTRFTKGVIKTNLGRMAPRDKVHIVSRALWRRIVS